MSKGIFTDRLHQPVMEEICAAVGKELSRWEDLTRYMRENYRPIEELKFYGKKLGWAVRFKRSSKALLSIYPGTDAFTAQIVMNSDDVRKALKLKLSKRVRGMLLGATEYPEGRWVFIDVENGQDVADIKKLLRLKQKPPGLIEE